MRLPPQIGGLALNQGIAAPTNSSTVFPPVPGSQSEGSGGDGGRGFLRSALAASFFGSSTIPGGCQGVRTLGLAVDAVPTERHHPRVVKEEGAGAEMGKHSPSTGSG
jgi:hypothetical protein